MAQMILLSALIGIFSLPVQAEDKPLEPVAVVIKNAQGDQVGDLNLTQEADGVKVVLNLTKLKPGIYAVHFHENGVCKGPDFKSAGDHFNPTKAKHGMNTPGGPHAGDMPNVEVKEQDGVGHLELVNKMVTLKPGPNSLLKTGGTSIVVHAKPDDYKTQPSGGAGDRLACGEIKSPNRVKK